MVNPTIFRDYDIRGVYPTEINEETYYAIGRASAVYLNVDSIAVGRDTRVSSPNLLAAFIAGITDQGTQVIDLGLISTEMLYFASGYYRFPASAIVSASHNPPEYNGLKIVTQGAVPLSGERGLPEIKALVQQNRFVNAAQKGRITQQNILGDWVNHALSFINPPALRQLKVVVDAGNGMGGMAWTEVAKRLPISIIPLYFELDGTFPNHTPNPVIESNLTALSETVVKEKADFGIALDGDADRIVLLDNKGQMLSSTLLMAMLCQEILIKYGPGLVLYNVTIGRIVPEIVEKYGGTSMRVRVGHAFIKQYMKQYQALFAGETSGHYYFRDNFTADSSLIAGLFAIQFVSNQPNSLAEVAQEFNKYPQSGEINFLVPDAVQVIERIKADYSDAKMDEIDGLTFWYPDWWFNLRQSKTEPLLRLNVEANSLPILEEKSRDLVLKIQAMGGVEKKR